MKSILMILEKSMKPKNAGGQGTSTAKFMAALICMNPKKMRRRPANFENASTSNSPALSPADSDAWPLASSSTAPWMSALARDFRRIFAMADNTIKEVPMRLADAVVFGGCTASLVRLSTYDSIVTYRMAATISIHSIPTVPTPSLHKVHAPPDRT